MDSLGMMVIHSPRIIVHYCCKLFVFTAIRFFSFFFSPQLWNYGSFEWENPDVFLFLQHFTSCCPFFLLSAWAYWIQCCVLQAHITRHGIHQRDKQLNIQRANRSHLLLDQICKRESPNVSLQAMDAIYSHTGHSPSKNGLDCSCIRTLIFLLFPGLLFRLWASEADKSLFRGWWRCWIKARRSRVGVWSTHNM